MCIKANTLHLINKPNALLPMPQRHVLFSHTIYIYGGFEEKTHRRLSRLSVREEEQKLSLVSYPSPHAACSTGARPTQRPPASCCPSLSSRSPVSTLESWQACTARWP